MSMRNLIWLVVIVIVGAVLTVTVGWQFGLIGAGVTLAVSELVERSARRKRIAADRAS